MFFFGFFTSYVPYLILGLLYLGSLSAMVMPRFKKEPLQENILEVNSQVSDAASTCHADIFYSSNITASPAEPAKLISFASLGNNYSTVPVIWPSAVEQTNLGVVWLFTSLPPPIILV